MEYVDVQSSEIPALGFGTWQLTGSDCLEGVEHALSLGYRHIDTAQAYQNEDLVGRAIDNSSVPRDDIFLTTKVWRTEAAHDDVIASTEESLEKLGTDHVDLLLIHWPVDEVPFEETIEALDQLREDGKTRHIGISNYTPTQMHTSMEAGPVATNQVEYHPYLGQEDLLEIVEDHDLMLTAYSPLARGRVLDDETLTEIGDAHGKSPAQVALRWLVQQDRVSAIPKAASAEHRESNLEIFDFALSDDEMSRIDDLECGDRVVDPGFAPDWEQ